MYIGWFLLCRIRFIDTDLDAQHCFKFLTLQIHPTETRF